MMTYAVLRIRSPRRKSKKKEKTLRSLRLTRVNHCTVIPEDEIHEGMLKNVKDVVTWGEIEEDTLVELLKYRSSLDGGLTDEKASEMTEHDDVEGFAEAVLEGDSELTDLDGIENLFRLHPPKGGFNGVKKPFNTGGSLGYRGKEINDLLKRMIGPSVDTEGTG